MLTKHTAPKVAQGRTVASAGPSVAGHCWECPLTVHWARPLASLPGRCERHAGGVGGPDAGLWSLRATQAASPKGCPKSPRDWTVRLVGPSTVDPSFSPRGRHKLGEPARHGVERVVLTDSADVPEQGLSWGKGCTEETTGGGSGGYRVMDMGLALWLTSAVGGEVESPRPRDRLVCAESSHTGCIISTMTKSNRAISSSSFAPWQGPSPAPGGPSCHPQQLSCIS